MIKDVAVAFLSNAINDIDRIKLDKLPLSSRIELEKAKIEIKNARTIINQYNF